MAKKAAIKRGRPKGSKNSSSLVKQFSSMAFDAQKAVLDQLSSMYESAKGSRAAQLMAELATLGAYTGKKRGRPAKAAKATNGSKHPLAGRKAVAKYRSKKDPSLTWAGRGLPPKWMKAEMKGGKLKKEDFAI